MTRASDPPADGGGVPAARSRSAGRNLPVAIAVGLTLAVVFCGLLAIGGYVFLTFVAVAVVLGLVELDQGFRAHDLTPATPIAVGAGLVMIYGAYANGPDAQAVGIVALVLGATVWTLLDGKRRNVAASLGATCLGGLWVAFLASYIGLLLRGGELADGRLLVAAVIALVVANDIGAYAFGNRLGRHKMAPTVSPGKTWEGFAGGLVTVLAIAGLVTPRLVPGLGLTGSLVLGAGVVVAATIGDLSESLVKRDLGVKDLGRLLPGHGGVMDRIDAMLFALPVAYGILVAFGL
jgi:phosphatidate cytidylyltransferase